MNRFKDKVVLVTGGNRNTGLWLVKKFVDEGAKVFMCGSSAASTAKGIESLRVWFGTDCVVDAQKEDDGVVFLGNGWRGRWNDKTSPAYKFSRYIHPVKSEGKGPGFFHLMDEPIAGNRSRKSGKRIAAGAKRTKRPSRQKIVSA